MKGCRKELFVLVIEAVYISALIIKCFRGGEEYTLGPDSFGRSELFAGEITYFDDGSAGIETTGAGECELMTSSVRLRSGAYKFTVIYDSVSDYEGANIDNSAGELSFSAENPSILKASDIILCDGIHEMVSRIWIRPTWGSDKNEVKISVSYNGYGKLSIKSIYIEEKRLYRIIGCIFAFLLFSVLNFLYLVFCKKDSRFSTVKVRFIVAGLAAITFFPSMTYFADFLNPGHDLNFHLGRIVSLAESLREFQIPHRMQFKMLNGYGYATPLFYGEIFLLLPAVLYDFYVPLQTCYQIFVVVINFATGMISFWCFEKIAGDWRKGLFGAAIYTLSTYRMTDLIVRAAVGEYTAMVFFPLLLYGLWNLYSESGTEHTDFENCLPVVAAVTGIINSHILSCEMLMIFIVPFMLIKYRTTFSKRVLLTLIKSGIWSAMLNLWFVVPFLQSMTMNVRVSDAETINFIEKNGIYLSQLFGIFHTAVGGNVPSGRNQEMPLALGVSFVSGLIIFLFIYVQRERWSLSENKEMKMAKWCLISGMVAVFFSSGLCRWDNLVYINKELARLAGMVEFSWRYLALATLLFTVMMIFLMQVIEYRFSASVCRTVMIIIGVTAACVEGHFMTEWTNVGREEKVLSESDVDLTRFSSSDYLLTGTDREEYKKRDLLCGAGIENAEFYYDKKGRYYLRCDNLNEALSYVDVPVQAYDHYHAYQSDEEELVVGKGENNRIRITIPGNFQGAICLRYEVPGLWRVCELISFISFCAILGRIAIEWKNKSRREYCG